MALGILNTDASVPHLAAFDGRESQLCNSSQCIYLSLVMSLSNVLLQGKSKGAKEVLKRIDYGGTATLFATVRHKDHILFSPWS